VYNRFSITYWKVNKVTARHKEMLVLCYHYYNAWNEGEKEPDKRMTELLRLMHHNKGAVPRNEVMGHLERGIIKLEKLVNYENVTINGLIFCLNFIFLLIEEDAFQGYSKLASKRLVLEIYTTWEAIERHQEGFKMANIVATRYYINCKGKEVLPERLEAEKRYLDRRAKLQVSDAPVEVKEKAIQELDHNYNVENGLVSAIALKQHLDCLPDIDGKLC